MTRDQAEIYQTGRSLKAESAEDGGDELDFIKREKPKQQNNFCSEKQNEMELVSVYVKILSSE